MTTRYIATSLLIASLALTACGPEAPPRVARNTAADAPATVPAPQPAPVVRPARDLDAPRPAVGPTEASPVPATELPQATRVRLVDTAVATGVERRVPTGLGEVFSTDVGSVWAWVSVENLGAPTTLTMVWRRDDKVRSSLELPVGTSPRWRTWSRNRIRKFDAGEWTVDLYDADGNLLDTLEFTIRDTGDIG